MLWETLLGMLRQDLRAIMIMIHHVYAIFATRNLNGFMCVKQMMPHKGHIQTVLIYMTIIKLARTAL